MKTRTNKSVGKWVVNPHNGQRGVISHVYNDALSPSRNNKGFLIQVDFANRVSNCRQADIELSKDQTSKWADHFIE